MFKKRSMTMKKNIVTTMVIKLNNNEQHSRRVSNDNDNDDDKKNTTIIYVCYETISRLRKGLKLFVTRRIMSLASDMMM